jgi:hypothetical protein
MFGVFGATLFEERRFWTKKKVASKSLNQLELDAKPIFDLLKHDHHKRYGKVDMLKTGSFFQGHIPHGKECRCPI